MTLFVGLFYVFYFSPLHMLNSGGDDVLSDPDEVEMGRRQVV